MTAGKETRYLLLTLFACQLFFAGFLLRGQNPLQLYYTPDGTWIAPDVYHSNVFSYLQGKRLLGGFVQYDLSQNLGLPAAGSPPFGNSLSPIGVAHYAASKLLGLDPFAVGGAICLLLLMFELGTFFHLLARYLGHQPEVAFMGSLALLGVQYFAYYHQYVNYSGAFSFFPLGLIFAIRYRDGQGWKDALALAVVLALPMSFGMYGIYVNYYLMVCASTLALVWEANGTRKVLRRHAPKLVSAFLLAVLLNAVNWVPFLSYLRAFPLSAGQRVAAEYSAINPVGLLVDLVVHATAPGAQYFLPGTIGMSELLFPYWGLAHCLFLLGLIRTRFTPVRAWYLLILVLSVSYYLLNAAGVHWALYDTMKILKYQSTIAYPFMAIALVDGVRAAIAPDGAWRYRGLALSMAVLSALLLVALGALYLLGYYPQFFGKLPSHRIGVGADKHWTVYVAFLLGQLGVALAIVWNRRPTARYWGFVSLALVGTILVFPYFNWGGVVYEDEFIAEKAFAVENNERWLAARVAAESNLYRSTYYEPIWRKKYYINNAFTGFPTIEGFGVFMEKEQQELISRFFQSHQWSYDVSYEPKNPASPIFSRLFGVKYILSERSLGVGRLVRYDPTAHWKNVYELDGARPLVGLVNAVEVFAGEAQILDYVSSPKNMAQLSPSTALMQRDVYDRLGLRGVTGLDRENVIREVRLDGDRIRVEVDARSPGLLELNFALNRYWRAYADGQPRELVPVNYAFRALPIRPGDGTIVLKYEFPAAKAGGLVTVVLVIATMVTWVVLVRRSRASAARATTALG